MPKEIFDYIVVGAGAAGSVLAARLAESGKNKILLIEAGPNNIHHPLITNPSSYLYLLDIGEDPSPSHLGFRTVSQLGKVYTYPRGTGLGGSTNHHAMVDGRGSRKVFDQWAKLTNNSLWSYENILPFYKKMENYRSNEPANEHYHGKNGWLQITQSQTREIFFDDLINTIQKQLNVPWREDFNIPGHEAGIGFADAQISQDGRRSNAATDLLLPTLERCQVHGWNNLTLLTDTLTTKIIFSKKKAIGVETIHCPHAFKVDAAHKHSNFLRGQEKIYLASKEVIVCCGSINTPQLLLLSGIGPKEHLEALNVPCIYDSPGVGTQILDHTEIAVVHRIKNLPSKVWAWQAHSLAPKDPTYRAYIDATAVSENQIPFMFDWHSGYDQPDPNFPDLHIHLCKFYFRDFNLNRDKNKNEDSLKASYVDAIMTQLDSQDPQAYHTSLIELMKNTSCNGYIRLKSTQPTDAPEIDLKLYESDADMTRLALGIQLMRKIFDAQGMQKYTIQECLPGPNYHSLDDLKDYIRRYSSFGHHIGGTAKMGALDDPMSVVDATLKVKGIEGLRICDASIFPVLPSYNPSHSVYLIAEVLSSLLL